MFSFIRKRVELKIIISLTLVIACMIGVSALIDIRIKVAHKALCQVKNVCRNTVVVLRRDEVEVKSWER